MEWLKGSCKFGSNSEIILATAKTKEGLEAELKILLLFETMSIGPSENAIYIYICMYIHHNTRLCLHYLK